MRADDRHRVLVATQTTDERLWTGPHGRVALGIFSLAFLIAFESLAVATVMPVVARDLDGIGLFALAFATPMAVGVISMTLAGPEIDRHGPGRALRLGVVLFSVGLLVAGTAPTMWVFLLGRAAQGFGSGFVGVGLYVVVGRAFPDHLRAQVFTVMTSAWLLPALGGPVLAAAITDLLGWRWVFLGVPLIAVMSLLLIRRALAEIGGDPGRRTDHRRTWLAILVTSGIVSISVAGQRSVPGWPVVLIVSTVVVVGTAPRLLPVGTWRGRRGLPSIIATRSLLSAGYFSAETYVPLSLVEHRELSVTAAGLFLTNAAVLWFAGSWAAAHLTLLESKARRVRFGTVAVLLGIMSAFLILVPEVPTVVVALVWSLGGMGMGMATSTLGVLMLDSVGRDEQGAASAAMQTSDSIVQSVVLALGSVAFAWLLPVNGTTGFLLVFAAATTAGLGALTLSSRLSSR